MPGYAKQLLERMNLNIPTAQFEPDPGRVNSKSICRIRAKMILAGKLQGREHKKYTLLRQ